jgi:hypothetical protein
MIIGTAVSAVAILATAGGSDAACGVGQFSFFANQTTDVRMVADSGKSCGIIVRAGSHSRYDGVNVRVPPRHGTVSSRAGVGVTYRSRPGFKGEDTFVFSVTGQMWSGTGTATIRVAVTVN